MTDIESELFTKIATALRAQYGAANITVYPEYVAAPAKFPAVFIQEMDNSIDERAIDNGNVENAANVMYQVDVYSNKSTGKKAQAKEILALIDAQMNQLRFIRTFKNPVENLNDTSIYRLTARYKRRITDTEML